MIKILKIIKEIIDFSIFLILASSAMVVSLPFRVMRGRSAAPVGRPDIMHVSNAISIAGALKKYGTLEYMYNYAGKMRDFRRNIFVWCPLEKSDTLRDGDWIFYERRPILKYLRWTAIFVHVYIAAFRHRKSVAVIRSWGPFYPGIPVMMVSRSLGIPYCVSIHADYDVRYRLAGAEHSHIFLGSRRLGRLLEKIVMQNADGVLAQFKMHAGYAKSLGVPDKNITFIYHGINIEPFRVPPDAALIARLLTPGKKIVSMVGRITKDNYASDVAEIALQVLSSRRDVRFVFAGDGDMLGMLKEKLSRHIADGSVIAPGFIPHAEVVELRKSSSVNLCLMGGFSLLEACASGRPALAYDVEWHSEIIESGVSGVLVNEGDVAAAAAAVSRFLDDESLASAVGAAARRAIFERHDIEESHRMKNDFYLKVADSMRSEIRRRQ